MEVCPDKVTKGKIMLYEESLWIEKHVAKIKLPPGSTVLNLGSSTSYYREKYQPYINKHVINPVLDRGLNVIHADQKKDRGVDIIINVEKIKLTRKYDMVLCTSMLEHVKHIKAVTRKVIGLVKKHGYLLISVPRQFPYHADPIDNGFRPSAKELAAFFPGQKIIRAETIRDRAQHSNVLKYKQSIVLLEKVK